MNYSKARIAIALEPFTTKEESFRIAEECQHSSSPEGLRYNLYDYLADLMPEEVATKVANFTAEAVEDERLLRVIMVIP